MTQDNNWINTPEEKLRSLIADEAKNTAMMFNIASTVKQMQAKSTFRLALLNQLMEELLKEK
jgi:hypothetical protein